MASQRNAFRLAPVLKVRTEDRDIERTRFAQTMQALDQIDKQIAVAEHELACLRARTGEAVRERTLDVAAIADTNRFEAELRRELRHLESHRKQLQAAVAAAQASLKQADGRVRGLERLRDRHDRQHRDQVHRQESRENTERLAAAK